jgi:hypothetical protein
MPSVPAGEEVMKGKTEADIHSESA